MAQSFYVTDVTIGREGNVITYANDGSMVFSDRFVPGVRLVDLLNGSGSEGGGAASITKEVLTTDWGLDHHDPIYNRDFWTVSLYYALIGFNIQLTDPTKVRATAHLIITTSPLATETIEFDDILTYSDHLKIVSSSKAHCYINVESA
jgi:hypothetical protein